jgi:hypothetical protein
MDKVGVPAELKAEIKASVAENIGKGMPRSEAERAAVNSKIAETIGSLESIRDRLEEKGHDVAKVEIDTPRVAPKAEAEPESFQEQPEIPLAKDSSLNESRGIAEIDPMTLSNKDDFQEWVNHVERAHDADSRAAGESEVVSKNSGDSAALAKVRAGDAAAIKGTIDSYKSKFGRPVVGSDGKVTVKTSSMSSQIYNNEKDFAQRILMERISKRKYSKESGVPPKLEAVAKELGVDTKSYKDRRNSSEIVNAFGKRVGSPEPIVDATPQGKQTVIPGAEKISDKQLAEKKMGEKKYADVKQKPMDDGLFDLGARKQQEIKFATQPVDQVQPYALMKPQPSGRAKASQSDQAAAIMNAAQRILGKEGARRVVLASKITQEGNKNEIAGANLPESQIIAIALNAPRPDGVLRHESIHYLRDMGLINEADWNTLSQQAKRWRKMFDIDARYKGLGLDETALNEEAIADGYQAWYNGDLDLSSGTLNSIMQKIADFYAAVRDYLFSNNGVQSWSDVFDAIESGAVGGEVRGAPGYNIEVGDASVKLVAPDGTITEYPSMRDAEYAATDAAIFNELNLKAEDKADYSLGEEEQKKAAAFAGKHMQPYNGSITQKIKDTADAVARMTSGGEWKTTLRALTADSAAIIRTLEKKFAPDRMDRQLIAYQRANLANKSGAVFDVFYNGNMVQWDAKDRVFKEVEDTKGWNAIIAPIKGDPKKMDLFASYWLAKDALTPRKRKIDMKKAKELFGEEKAKKLFAENKVEQKQRTLKDGTKESYGKKTITIPIFGIEFGTEKNISEAEAKEIIRIVEAQTGKDGKNIYKDTLNELQKYHRKIVDGLVGSGEISADLREYWDHEFYAPARKIMQDTYDMARGRRGNPVKKRTGGPDIFNIIDKNGEVIKVHGQPIRHGTLAQAQADAEQRGGTVQREIQKRQDLFHAMAELHAAMIQKSYQTVASQNAMQVLEAAGLAFKVGKQVDFNSEFLQNALDENDSNLDLEAASWLAPLTNKGNNTIGIKVNGKIETYRIDDPLVFKMMEQMAGYAAYSPNMIMRTLMQSRGLFTRMITLTPMFQARNVVRDAGARAFVSPDQHKMFKDTVGGLRGALDDKKVIRLMMSGGDVGYYTRTAEDAMKALDHKASKGERSFAYWANPMRVVDGMERLGRLSELTGRLAMFDAAKRAGATDLEAGFEAADLADFSRRGLSDSIRILTNITPFLNPRIQGLDKTLRTVANKQMRKNLIVKSAILMTAALALAAHNGEDEETRRDYAELDDYVKNANFYFSIRKIREAMLGRKLKPDETAGILIPKPFEWGYPATLVERVYTAAQNDALGGKGAGSWSDARQAGLDTLTGLVAFNPLSNPLLGVPVEQMTNYKFFQQQPIEPRSGESKMAADRYTAGTSATAIAAAEFMDKTFGGTISPARLEHLIMGTTASMGDMVLMATDAMLGTRPAQRFNTVPVVGAFTSPSVGSGNQVRNDFYALNKEIAQTAGSINAARNDGDIEGMKELLSRPKTKALMAVKPQMDAIKNQMDVYQKQINRLQRSSNGMTPDARREKIDMLTQKSNDVAYKFKDVYLRYEELRDKE